MSNVARRASALSVPNRIPGLSAQIPSAQRYWNPDQRLRGPNAHDRGTNNSALRVQLGESSSYEDLEVSRWHK